MGLFGLFKKTPVVQDADFGEMRFYKSKKADDEFFEAEGYFKPLNAKVGFIIQANETGPTKEQKLFLRFVEDNYEGLTEKMKPLIIDKFRNWKENFVIVDFNKEFTPESITIPRFTGKPLIWEICFTTTHDSNHWVTIDLTDFEPTGILVDG